MSEIRDAVLAGRTWRRRPAGSWTWLDREARPGPAQPTGAQPDGRMSREAGTEWFVTLAGRQIPVTVESWRERTLAEARLAEGAVAGPVEIRSTLPGLVVAVNVAVGSEVEEGEALVTIEAMKMQNEVRAPRAGRIGRGGRQRRRSGGRRRPPAAPRLRRPGPGPPVQSDA